MLKILICGGSGLVGSRIIELLGDKYQIIAPSHQQVDLSDKKQMEGFITKTKPSHIIYAAGLTSIDNAEENPEQANLLNVKAPSFIAKCAITINASVLYFSTDAVFDGFKSSQPYLEDDKTHPVSNY